MISNDSRGGNSASNLKLVCFNLNSIGKNPKRRQVLHFLRKKNPDILITIDTRFSNEIENSVKTEWGGQVFFSSFDSQSRGVAIFIKNNLPIKILDTYKDTNGNVLCILVEYENKRIIIEGIYGPNGDSPRFFETETFSKIEIWNPHHSIFVGDYNLVLDQNLDTMNYQHINNPLARAELVKKMSEHNLLDIFRELNPSRKKFSWKQWGNSKFARLDFFLISDSLLPYVEKADILPTCFSDHSPIILEIDFAKFQRGKGFWKFNNSLLTDKNYVDLIKKIIKRVTCQYARNENIPELFEHTPPVVLNQFLEAQTPESLQALDIKINPELFLDTILMEIRGATIKYSSELKRKNKAQEELLAHDIEILENQIQNNPFQNFHLEELNDKKEALENILKHEAEGAFVRSRVKYKLEGEKPSKTFCALEKHNGVQRYVPQLFVTENDREILIKDQKDVEKEIFKFYKNLFANKDNPESGDIKSFLGLNCNSVPTLSENQKHSMEGKLTLEELTNYLKKCKNNVAPGTSGFSFDFYKFFWRDLKYFILRATDYAFENKKLSVSQNMGIISIIPKGDKDKRYIGNWRPLCLLNSFYKLISGAIAERIKPVLDTIVHNDQKGFVGGRYIGEVIRTTFDTIQYAKDNNKTGLLLTVDFEKAYDSISFKFIKKCLTFLNFGSDLIKWIEILLYDFQAVVNHCGNISSRFDIARGCRQGDPIASYLFIICVEILAHKLRNDPFVKGFQIGNLSHLLEIYADDLTIFLSPNSENLRQVINILDNFYNLSGLKISISKTKAVWFGKDYNSNQKLCPDINLNWCKQFTLLGINFDNNLDDIEINFFNTVRKMEKIISNWFYRYLTPYGKVTVIKTLGLSMLSHVALIIPNPSKRMFKQIENIFFKFIWNKKSEKIRRDDAKLPEKLGGLNVPDIENFWLSFKFSWFRRLCSTQSFWPNIILQEISQIQNQPTTISEILNFGPTLLGNVGKKLSNKFWQQVLLSARNISENAIFCHPQKLSLSSFWQNPLIKRNNKVIQYRDFPELKNVIFTVSDFFYPQTNNMMNIDDLRDRYSLDIEDNKYIDICYIITLALQKIGFPRHKLIVAEYPLKPLLIDVALAIKKGCSVYYKILMEKNHLKNKNATREEKWHLELNKIISVFTWDKIRKLYASINHDNPAKWLQHQIVRNSLQTNVIVSHFKANVVPECDFCHFEPEKISHLFWHCRIVSNFLNEVSNTIKNTGIQFAPTREQFLFGYIDQAYFTPPNILVLHLKKYIWNTKFKSSNILSLVGFKNYFRIVLKDLKKIYELKDKSAMFNVWNDFHVLLPADEDLFLLQDGLHEE